MVIFHLSLAPGFSRVVQAREYFEPLQRFREHQKPLKRWHIFDDPDTRLKPERCSCRSAAVSAAPGVVRCGLAIQSQFLVPDSVPRWCGGRGAPHGRSDAVSRRDGGATTAWLRLKHGANEIFECLCGVRIGAWGIGILFRHFPLVSSKHEHTGRDRSRGRVTAARTIAGVVAVRLRTRGGDEPAFRPDAFGRRVASARADGVGRNSRSRVAVDRAMSPVSDRVWNPLDS